MSSFGLDPNDLASSLRPNAPQDWKPTSAGDFQLQELAKRDRAAADKLFFADFMETAKYDPEKASEVRKLGIEIGQPLDDETIANNLDEVRRIAYGVRVKRMDLAKNSPFLRMQLEDPEFARLAWDQAPELGTIEKIFNNVKAGFLENEYGKLGSSIIGRVPTALEAQELTRIRNRISTLRKDDVAFLGPAARIVGQIGEGLPNILVGAGAGAAVGSVVPVLGTGTGATAGAMTAMAIDSYRVNSGQLYMQMLEQGYSTKSASQSAVASGILNAGLEVLGGAVVTGTARRVLREKIMERAGKEVMRPMTTGSSLRRRLIEYGAAVGGETSTEVMQEVVNIFAEEVARRHESNLNRIDPETGKPITSTYSRGESLDVIVDTAIEVAQGMAVLGLGSPAVGAFGDRRAVQQVETTQTFLSDLQQGVSAQKVSERAPDKFEQFLSQLADGTPAENIHIDSAEFERVLIESGVTSEQIAAELPEVAEQIKRASSLRAEMPVDIVIPIAEFGGKIVPRKALFELLKPHVRLDGDQMSMAELERDQQAIPEEMAASQEAMAQSLDKVDVAKEELRAIESEIVSQLVATGMDNSEARDNALPTRNFVANRAEQTGQTPSEFWSTYKLTVQREQAVSREPDSLFSDGARKTDTPEFREWFGESRVVDESGAPLVVYHGTNATFDEFKSNGFNASGQRISAVPAFFFTSNEAVAETYADPASGRVIPVYIAANRVAEIDANGGHWSDWIDQALDAAGIVDSKPAEMLLKLKKSIEERDGDFDWDLLSSEEQQELTRLADKSFSERGGQKQATVDAVRVVNAHDLGRYPQRTNGSPGGDVYVVFNPTQIKSVNNIGAFDKNDPNILRATGEGTPDPLGAYGRTTRTINLYKEARATTFLHELSHYFIDVTIDVARSMAQAGKIDATIENDVSRLFDWWEVGDPSMTTSERIAVWDALDPKVQEEKHEAFAYSWENFVTTGKAPTPRLKRLFSRLAAWARSFYKDFRDTLNVTYRSLYGKDLPILTEEVRGVMERMIESQEAIDNALQGRAMLPQFATQEESGMSDQQWSDYQDSIAEANDQAVDELTAKVMKDARWAGRVRLGRERELRAEAGLRRSEIAEEELATERRRRVHRARQFFKTGERTDEAGEVLRVDEVHKLRTADVKTITDRDLKALRITTPDGLDPWQVSSELGYSSALEMIDDIATAPSLADVVKAKTDARMIAENGNLVNKESVDAAVMQAVYNSARMRAIAQQIGAMEGLTSRTRLKLAAAKQLAKQRIDATKISDLRPDSYEQSAVRARRQAFRLLKQDDRRGAAAAFRSELVYSMMAREAAIARQEIDKSKRRVAGYFAADSKLSKRREMGFVHIARSVLAWAGLGTASKSPQEHVANLAQYEPEFFETVKPVYDRAEANAVDDYRKLTMEQFRDSVEIADMLWRRSRSSKLVTINGKLVELDAISAVLMESLDKTTKEVLAKLGTTHAVTEEDKKAVKRSTAKGLIRRAEWYAIELDGGKAGVITDTLVQTLQDATYRYEDRRRAVVAEIRDMFAKINKATSKAPVQIRAETLGENGYTFGVGKQNAVAEIMAALLHSGTESSLDRLADPKRQLLKRDAEGNTITAPWFEFVQEMIDEGHITADMLALVNRYWAIGEELKPEIQAAARKLTGRFMNELEARPFTLTVNGEVFAMTGGYAPAKYDRFASKTSAKVEDATAQVTATDSGILNLTPSFLKDRVSGFADVIDLDLRQTLLSFDEAMKWAFIAPAVKDVNTILSRTEFGRQLQERRPGAIDSVFMPLMVRALTQRLITRQHPGSSMMRHVRQVFGMTRLALNVPNAVQNYLGTIPVEKEIGAKWMAYGWRHADWTVAVSKSGFMRSLRDRSQTEVAEEMTEMVEDPGKIKTVAGQVRRYGYILPSITQSHMSLAAWTGAYYKALETEVGPGAEYRVSVYADRVVRLQLGSTAVLDSAAYEGAFGELGRLFTQFTSWFNNLGEQQRNIWIRTVGDIGYRGIPAFFWEWFQVVYGQIVAGAAISMFLRGQWDDDDDGLEDELLQLMLHEPLVGSAAAMMPVVGGAAAKALSGFIYDDPSSYGGRDKLLQAPAISAIESIVSGLGTFAKAAKGEKSLDGRALRTVLDIASIWTGAPVSAVSGQLGYLVDLLSGKVKPLGAWDAARGIVVGSAAKGTRQK